MNGLLVVDKPSGPTSHDVVARARALLGVKRVGHTGTLDPLASGVLPLVVGRATRLARFLAGGEKCYDAVVRLGVATDTYDALGKFAETTAPVEGLTREVVDGALEAFRGTFWQTPPPYSAKTDWRRFGRTRWPARRSRPNQNRPRSRSDRLTLEGYDAGARARPRGLLRGLLRPVAGARPGSAAGLRRLSRVAPAYRERRLRPRRRGPVGGRSRRTRHGRRMRSCRWTTC